MYVIYLSLRPLSYYIMYIFLPRVSVLRYIKILWSYDTLLGEVSLLFTFTEITFEK